MIAFEPRRVSPAIAVPLCVLLLAPSLPAEQEQAAARRTDPRRLVERAIEAMGGAPALRDLRTTVIEFTSTNFGLGQEETPQSPPRATIGFGKITTDWQASRRLAEQENRPVTGVIQRTRQVVVEGIGMNDVNGTLTVAQPQGVANVLTGMRLQPHRFLLAALENPAGLRGITPATFRGERMDGLRYAIGPDTMNLWFDRPSGLVVVSEIVTDDPILGDRRTLTWYTRWRGLPVKLPWQVDTEVNGRLLSHNVVTSLRENEPVDPSLFAIPDSIRSRATPAPATPPPPPPVTVTLVELAPGVWRAEGGSHHSLVVDQGNRVIVVEAPQNARRMNAVLDTLRTRFPNKPVGQVVNTHHHWDHAGGVRAALGRGIPVVTHTRNGAFIRGIASARKTVAPDALSRRRSEPRITVVTDTLSLGSGDSRVLLVTIPSIHAEGILAAYVPSARILFVSDVLSPGPTLSPVGSAEVVALARARALTIERVAGGHGGVANWADVEQAAGR